MMLSSLRSAVAVHNIGCALLETNRHDAAHKTLADAAKVLTALLLGLRRGGRGGELGQPLGRAVGVQVAAHSDDRTRQPEAVVAAMLDAANQRLARRQEGTIRPTTESSRRLFVSPLLLRIDVEALETDDGLSGLTVMTAISVHNYGISCLCRSIEAGVGALDTQRLLQDKAIFLLQSSYSIINNHCGTMFVPTTGALAIAHRVLTSLQVAMVFRIEALAVVVEEAPPSSSSSSQHATRENLVRAIAAVQDELDRLCANAPAFEIFADPNVVGRGAVFAAAA